MTRVGTRSPRPVRDCSIKRERFSSITFRYVICYVTLVIHSRHEWTPAAQRVPVAAMPQRGVTLHDVEEAMDALRASGRSVNVRNVREALGERGSLTTIAAHVRKIRARDDAQHATSGPVSGPALPDPVVEGLMRGAQKHWSALNDAAEAIVEQAQARAAERVQAARDAERDARTEADAARAERDTADAARAERESELEALRAEHATLTEAHRACGVALELSLERQRGTESLAEERRHTIDSTIAALERARTERDDARAALERARAEAKAREMELADQLAAVEAERRDAAQAVARTREQLSHAATALEQRTEERDAMQRALEETRTALEAERSGHGDTARELATHRERCDGFSSALAQSQDHARSLAAMVERANKRAAAAEAALRVAEAVEALQEGDPEGGGASPPPSAARSP